MFLVPTAPEERTSTDFEIQITHGGMLNSEGRPISPEQIEAYASGQLMKERGIIPLLIPGGGCLAAVRLLLGYFGKGIIAGRVNTT